ncbi:SAM-dependent methyltransferase [Methanobacterium sp. MBAC-LM]|uniref:SAM-dependent methyltransferase n=1 Tax=Methanobacterium sp. MBAC-LM TaxID=3412034 RepID=UPI003C77759C
MMAENVKKGPSKMAEVVALIRAEESKKPADKRICYDPYAIYFTSPEMREFMTGHPEKYKAQREQVERSLPGYSNSIVARVRYFDDIVKLSVQNRLEQLVIMGAGYDTRAYRIGELKNVHVFEIDHHDTIKVKKEKINEIFGFIPDHVTYVPADLEVEKLDQKLAESGYDKTKRTLFLMEGLIYYLPHEAVDELLSFIVHSSGKKSAVIFDYGKVKPDNNAHKGKSGYEFAKQRGEPVKSSINEPIEKFLSERGFHKIKNMDSEDYKKVYFYGKNANREVNGMASFVYAVVE